LTNSSIKNILNRRKKVKQQKLETTQKVKQLLQTAETELRKIFKDKLRKIILFGSYSRGDYDDESDVDVMVLIDDSNPKGYDDIILDVEVDLSIANDIVLTIFVENEAEYQDGKLYKPFLEAIEQEGIEIYGV
jgi:predicted nucleotidyltransferase